ncbi:hypothetical protein J6590_022895, partial [Homalodisca vitripennis]
SAELDRHRLAARRLGLVNHDRAPARSPSDFALYSDMADSLLSQAPGLRGPATVHSLSLQERWSTELLPSSLASPGASERQLPLHSAT